MKAPPPLVETLFAHQPLRLVKGLASAWIAYPVAERIEKRSIRPHLRDLRAHYRLPIEQRLRLARERLAEIASFAGAHVPYWRDLFARILFDPQRLRDDIRWLQDLPVLTKDIIREQGERLLSQPLQGLRHHACKTGGSTGLSCMIYYDQPAADRTSAVTLYCRERAGKAKHKVELHFACRFPDAAQPQWPSREDFKCFAMNRSNIFFDRLDAVGAEEIWRTLRRRRPYLAHAHPSTIYALACHIEATRGQARAFDVFESSGELLEPHQRRKIEQVLRCRVVDRYGLAELGVMAYEIEGHERGLQVLDSEGWAESRPAPEVHEGRHELIFTGFHNRLMPLIRYATGDLARVELRDYAIVLTDVVGRIHDMVPIKGVMHPTHHVQDMLDHRVGGIQEFQIDLRTQPPTLRIVPEPHAAVSDIQTRIQGFWQDAFLLHFCTHDDLVRVGHRGKFRHVVTG